MQGAWVPSLVWEDPTSCWTTKPSCRNYWNPCALGLPGQMSPRAATTEALASRACVPQQEKPLQWEAHAPQLESSPHSLQLEKSPHSCKDPVQPKERKKANPDSFLEPHPHCAFAPSYSLFCLMPWIIHVPGNSPPCGVFQSTGLCVEKVSFMDSLVN